MRRVTRAATISMTMDELKAIMETNKIENALEAVKKSLTEYINLKFENKSEEEKQKITDYLIDKIENVDTSDLEEKNAIENLKTENDNKVDNFVSDEKLENKDDLNKNEESANDVDKQSISNASEVSKESKNNLIYPNKDEIKNDSIEAEKIN